MPKLPMHYDNGELCYSTVHTNDNKKCSAKWKCQWRQRTLGLLNDISDN